MAELESIFALVIVPILIFTARVCDVSLGTIRIIFISKGYRFLSAVLGFFEILIWLVAMRYIFLNLTNIFYYLAYAGGFATGTFVGVYIEEKISVGKVMVRIITKKNSFPLLNSLKRSGYTVTSNGAKTPGGNVKTIFTVIRRKDINKVTKLVNKYNPSSSYTISDVRYATEEQKKYVINHGRKQISDIFRFSRKGK